MFVLGVGLLVRVAFLLVFFRLLPKFVQQLRVLHELLHEHAEGRVVDELFKVGRVAKLLHQLLYPWAGQWPAARHRRGRVVLHRRFRLRGWVLAPNRRHLVCRRRD